MDKLTGEILLPPFGLVTVEASPGSQDWRVRIFIEGPDRRYSLGIAHLSKKDMLQVIDRVMSAIEAAGDHSNFNAVAIRKRSLGEVGGLEMEAEFHPDRSLVLVASAPTSTGANFKWIKNAEQFVRHIQDVIAFGDRMVA